MRNIQDSNNTSKPSRIPGKAYLSVLGATAILASLVAIWFSFLQNSQDSNASKSSVVVTTNVIGGADQTASDRSATQIKTDVKQHKDAKDGTQEERKDVKEEATEGNTREQLPSAPETLDDMLTFAESLLVDLKRNVRDYKAILVKRERIGGKLHEESRMEIKVRNAQKMRAQDVGLASYFYFLSPKSAKGREVIWVDGENDNKILAHETGLKRLVGTLRLEPNGRLAMLGQKYPIYEVGMIRLVEKLIEKGNEEPIKSQATITIDENSKVGDRKCRMIQVTLANQSQDADFHVARIFIDMERMIPLRYAAYRWPEGKNKDLPLEEEYTYMNVELNVGLQDIDFDPENPAYNFP